MSLSGPSLLQNATSASRRPVSQVGKETFPNWVSRSASKAKTVGTNQPSKRHSARPTKSWRGRRIRNTAVYGYQTSAFYDVNAVAEGHKPIPEAFAPDKELD